MAEPLLEAIDLEFAYPGGGERRVFRDLRLSVPAGAFTGVLGPNGSGKTTLLKLLCGLLAPTRGEVRLGGRPLASLEPREWARDVAFVPPEASTDAPFTVLECVLMGRFPRQGPFAFDSDEDVAIARRSLERVDALAFERRFLFELSAGEKQRVLLARALAQEPRAILLDEPTSHLDLGHQVATYGLLRDLNRGGLTVVVVSHDVNLAGAHCRTLVLLDEGRIVSEGSPREVLRQDLLESVYRTPLVLGRHPSADAPWVFAKIFPETK